MQLSKLAKPLMIALAAVLVLTTFVSAALANRLSLSQQSFRQIWTPLTFSIMGSEGFANCNVTLEGSFHYRTFAKVRRSLIGYVTKVAFTHPCTGSAEAWALNGTETPSGLGALTNTLPWHITYEGFEGRLPTITGMRLLFAANFVYASGITGLCLFEGNIQGVMQRESRGGALTGTVVDNTIGIPRKSGGIFCLTTDHFSGTGGNTRTAAGSEVRITLTLI
jgi:hypothetical protein